jgi:hypothetical protein
MFVAVAIASPAMTIQAADQQIGDSSDDGR